MRTRDLCARLNQEISVTHDRQGKLTLIGIIAKMERAELELRRLRKIAHSLLGLSKGKRVTSNGFRAAHVAKAKELDSRLQALLESANTPDGQSATQEGNY